MDIDVHPRALADAATTTSSTLMATHPAPPSALLTVSATRGADERDSRRADIVQHVLQRAQVAKMMRTLQVRLSLAGFKASRGLQQFKLDWIEPHLTQQAQERKRKSGDSWDASLLPFPKRRSTHGSGDSLYTTSMATTLSNSNAVSYSPALGPITTTKPLSTSDPAFVTSANEYVDAAHVLNSLSRAPSDASVLAGSGLGSPRSPHIGHHARNMSQVSSVGGGGGSSMMMKRPSASQEEEQEDAAELMLFLAASPSPKAKSHVPSASIDGQIFGATGVKGRKLFAEDASVEEQRQANQPFTQHNVLPFHHHHPIHHQHHSLHLNQGHAFDASDFLSLSPPSQQQNTSSPSMSSLLATSAVATGGMSTPW